MGKMPIIWHHRFGIQGLKSATSAYRTNPKFLALCPNDHGFQLDT